MPTNRRRRAQPRRANAVTSKRVLYKLLTGHDFANLDSVLGIQENRANETELTALRKLWAEAWPDVGEQIIEWHLHGTAPADLVGPPRPARPGSRPWGFWAFDDDVPEPRPTIRMEAGGGFALVHADGREETELAFLRRHRLLNAGEKKSLAAMA